MRGLIRHWDELQLAAGAATAAAVGTVLVNGGGGGQPLERSRNFQELGFPACVLLDNDDRNIDGLVATAAASGVAIARWSFGNCLEAEVIATISIKGLQALVAAAIEIRDDGSIRDAVAARLNNAKLSGTDIQNWQEQANVDSEGLRAAITTAAKSRGWFKTEDHGEQLANVVLAHQEGMASSHLMQVLGQLREFIYAIVEQSVPAMEE